MRDMYEKILRSKMVHLKKIYKFCFDHFLLKRTVLVLIEKTFLKIKSCGFRTTQCEIRKKCLETKLFISKRSTNFILIKCTVFVLIMKNVIKNQKLNFPDKLRHTKKMFRNKIVHFKRIYKFYFNHFLIKCTVFVLIMKNVIKNQKFNFPGKLYDIRNKC